MSLEGPPSSVALGCGRRAQPEPWGPYAQSAAAMEIRREGGLSVAVGWGALSFRPAHSPPSEPMFTSQSWVSEVSTVLSMHGMCYRLQRALTRQMPLFVAQG